MVHAVIMKNRRNVANVMPSIMFSSQNVDKAEYQGQ